MGVKTNSAAVPFNPDNGRDPVDVYGDDEEVDLTHEKARARERARASDRASINGFVDRVGGQVVESRGSVSKWS